MNKIQLNVLLFSLMLTFFSANILAQEKSILSETNLSEKTIKQPTTSADSKTSKGSSSQLSAPKELVNILPQQTKIYSLMFDDKESSNIDQVINLLKNNQLYGVNENAEGIEDQKNAQENRSEGSNDSKEKARPYIYLGSIIYLNDKEWAVWINDKKVTPETNTKDKEIYLKSVERDQVKVLWTPSVSKWKILLGQKSETLSPKINANNQVEMEFDLKPNQSFVLINNNVVEGMADKIVKTEDDHLATTKTSKITNQKNKQNVKTDNQTTDLTTSNDSAEKPGTSAKDSSNASNLNKSIDALTDKIKGILPSTPNGSATSDSEF